MEQSSINKLFLKTAFSCMACDGDIDSREVNLIKEMHEQKNTFGSIDIDNELEQLLHSINRDSQMFLREYFSELTSADLSEHAELKLIEIAIETIKADEKIEYSEIKFFKIIRSKLKIQNEAILKIHPDFEEYLEQDIISESYLANFMNDYLNVYELPQFDIVQLGTGASNSKKK